MGEYELWNRRQFIKTTVLAGGIVLLSRIPVMGNFLTDFKKITILHTNDFHSHLDPIPIDGSRNQGLGGIAARSDLIRKIRSMERNVLLFDAGDMFQGTPYFNYFKGEVELKAMSEMGYNAATLGNHEFDAGIESLARVLQFANFPIITSNYNFSDTPLAGKTIPNKIFDIDGIRIGVYGLGIEFNGLVPDKLIGNSKYLDALSVALEQENYLKNEKSCDMIICLSHLGLEYSDKKISDVFLAKNTIFTNLIIGGHTHKYMKEPMAIINLDKKICNVFQAGCNGLMLGRIDFYFSGTKSIIQSKGLVMNTIKNF
jgi:5'-nucleotidase